MAITLNPATKEITVQKSDLTPVSGTLYSLDTDQFRKAVFDLLASEDYIYMPDAFNHNTEVTVAGTTFARTIEFINGYFITFDDAGGTDAYSVRLEGSNNNIFDIQNGILTQNLTQVIPTNSAGLIVTQAGGGGNTPEEIADAVWEAAVAAYQGNPSTEMGSYILQQLAKVDQLIVDFTPLLPILVVDYNTFIQAFPEFNSTGIAQTYVETKIAEAGALLELDAYGSDPIHNIAVLYLTAHLLAISPYGQQLQLVNDDGSTVYGQFFNERLRFLVAKRGMLL